MKQVKSSIASLNGERLVDSFLRENIQCKILIHWMKKIFTYLDKFYTKNSATAPIGTLFFNGLKLYKEIVLFFLKQKFRLLLHKSKTYSRLLII
jgi:hypothetical protein